MNHMPEAPRTQVELQAFAAGLTLTGGRAPRSLAHALAAPAWTNPRTPLPADAYSGHMGAAFSLGALLLGFTVCVDRATEFSFVPAKPHVRVIAADPGGREAIAMAQDFVPAGDEKAVLGRLAAAVKNPAWSRAWSAERTDDDSYLVIFREPAGAAYAFEVNLEAESVLPAPETVERLTMLRVREEVESPAVLVAGNP